MTTSTSVNLSSKSASPIVLTDAAIIKVAELIAAEAAEETLALRIAVKSGGCSGFQYDMFFDSEFDSEDIVKECGTVKVVVDSQSGSLLTGATLDFTDGLQGAGFHITNPNATKTCGCGNSFS